MILRPKDPARVRADALRVASKKLAEGCRSCADGYIDLAVRNGASEDDIRHVYSGGIRSAASPLRVKSLGTSSIGPHKRDFSQLRPHAVRKIADISSRKPLGAVSTFVEAVTPKPTDTSTRRRSGFSSSDADPFGPDGRPTPYSPPVGGMTDFYIGQLGYGLWSNCGPCNNGTPSGCPAGTNTACFDIAAAQAAGGGGQAAPYYTYGYWGLLGPRARSRNLQTYPNPYDWGWAQGQKAGEAWLSGPYAQYVYGTPVFADIEIGYDGWGTDGEIQSAAQQADNRRVLDGFLTAITYWIDSTGTVTMYIGAGVYINVADIDGPNNNFFGPNYTPPPDPAGGTLRFVFWATGEVCCQPNCASATGNCRPCDLCNAAVAKPAGQNNWINRVHNACWANQGVVVWQFWPACPNSGCPYDFDYSPQSGYITFDPVPCTANPCLVCPNETRSPNSEVVTGLPFIYRWLFDYRTKCDNPDTGPVMDLFILQSDSVTPIGQPNLGEYRADDLRFSIPTNATIVGLEATVSYSVATNSYNAGGYGTPCINPSTFATPTSQSSMRLTSGGDSKPFTAGTGTYGGPTDTWGSTLTPPTVNSPSFGVIATLQSLTPTIEAGVVNPNPPIADPPPTPADVTTTPIHLIRMTIYYRY